MNNRINQNKGNNSNTTINIDKQIHNPIKRVIMITIAIII